MSTETATDLVRYQDEKEIMEIGSRFKEQIEALKITSQDSFNEMLTMIRTGKAHYKAAVEYVDGTPQKLGIRKRAQAVINRIREYLKPFEEGEGIGKSKMQAWERAEEKKRRDQEAAAAKKREEVLAEARKNGDEAKVEKIETTLPAPRENRAHVAGTSYVDNWKGKVVDMPALIKAVLAEKAPPDFIMLNESAVNKFAKATNGKVPVVGIEFYNDNFMKIGK